MRRRMKRRGTDLRIIARDFGKSLNVGRWRGMLVEGDVVECSEGGEMGATEKA